MDTESPRDDPRDAEVARLRDELAHATKAFDAAQYLRDLVRSDEIAERKRRRIDYGKLSDDDYMAIEDIVLLRAVDDLLNRVMGKHDEWSHYRKARWHIGALAMKLRAKLREKL